MKKSNKSNLKEQIAKQVLDRYLNSDFNGTLFNDIAEHFGGYKQAKEYIKDLVDDGVIELISANNPHIKGFDFSVCQKDLLDELFSISNDVKQEYETIFGDIKMVRSNKYSNFALYPTVAYLEKNIGNEKKYLEQPPFTKMMFFGKPWLEGIYFRVDVLDRYMEDPRYDVRYGDFSGDISFNSNDDDHKEQMYLKYFGLAHNKTTKENLVCVWAADLRRLTERHQYHFYSYMEQPSDDIIPDDDYYRTQIMGEWTERNSIYTAFLEEVKVINQMTKVICSKPLFRQEYSERDRCKLDGFHPFLKPTQRTLEAFCQTLDKLFTENLNKETILEIAKMYSGKVANCSDIESLGSLALLENFIKLYFHARDGTEAAKIVIDIWKNRKTGIRKIRSKAAHYVRDNKYDVALFKKYKEIINNAYDSIKMLRLILANNTKVQIATANKEIIIPDWLFDGKIRDYFIT